MRGNIISSIRKSQVNEDTVLENTAKMQSSDQLRNKQPRSQIEKTIKINTPCFYHDHKVINVHIKTELDKEPDSKETNMLLVKLLEQGHMNINKQHAVI